jgi:beta-lactamase class A
VADPFNAMLSDYLAGRAGKAEAAVWNLTSGQVFDLGGSSPEDDASIVKVNILEALLHEVGPVGLSTSQQALATAMIQQSDNDSATDLWYDSGGTAGIAQFDSGLGLIHTTVSQCVSCPGFPWPGWGLTSSTPSDQLLLLHALVTPNLLLSTTAQAYVLGLMEQVEPSEDWGVSVGVPSSATVALKNGWLPLEGSDSDWQINSEGYVNGDGRDYLISVMTSGSPTEQYGIDTIDEISTMVFAQMG